MNRDETKLVLAVLRAAYPNFYRDFGRDDLVAIVNLWQSVFENDEYLLVGAAVKALISSRTSTYPPVIGEVKQKLMELTQINEPTELEAWGLVSKAIQNGYHGYKEEFAKLPPSVQAAVGQPEQLREWAQMDVETTQSVVASNFMRAYRVVDKRRKEIAMLPADVHKAISQVADRLAFPQGAPQVRALAEDNSK